MSVASADPGGFVVITQVSPQPTQTDPSGMGHGTTRNPGSPQPLKTFYLGEPKALGVAQILTGIIQILFGLLYDLNLQRFSYEHMILFLSGVNYWPGILYIISGSISAAAASSPRIGLVRASLTMNIISAVAAVFAIVIYAFTIGILDYFNGGSCETAFNQEQCLRGIRIFVITYGLLCLMFIFTILELCVAISTSAFGCKTLCRTAYSDVSVVYYQTTSMNPARPDTSDVLPLEEVIKNP